MTTTTTTIYICGFALSHSAYLEYTPLDTKQTCPWISGHHSIDRVAKFQVFQKNGCLEFCDLTLLYIINPQWENNCVDKKEVDCVPSMLLCSPHSYKANICRGVEWLGISMSAKVSHLLDVVQWSWAHLGWAFIIGSSFSNPFNALDANSMSLVHQRRWKINVVSTPTGGHNLAIGSH
jgi:hypothetical protein